MWTKITRPQHQRKGLRYPSDMTDFAGRRQCSGLHLDDGLPMAPVAKGLLDIHGKFVINSLEGACHKLPHPEQRRRVRANAPPLPARLPFDKLRARKAGFVIARRTLDDRARKIQG
jgi:hypothetical protein